MLRGVTYPEQERENAPFSACAHRLRFCFQAPNELTDWIGSEGPKNYILWGRSTFSRNATKASLVTSICQLFAGIVLLACYSVNHRLTQVVPNLFLLEKLDWKFRSGTFSPLSHFSDCEAAAALKSITDAF
jgi:hypothetical protein